MSEKKKFLQGVLDAFLRAEGSTHASVLGVKNIRDAILVTSDARIASRIMHDFDDFGRDAWAISIQVLFKSLLGTRRSLVLDNSAVEEVIRVAIGEINDLENQLINSKREAQRHDDLLHDIAVAVNHRSHSPPPDQPHHGLLEAVQSLGNKNFALAEIQCSAIIGDDHGNPCCPITGDKNP